MRRVTRKPCGARAAGPRRGADQSDGPRLHAVPQAHGAEFFSGFGLHIHLTHGQAQGLGDALAHEGNVRCHARGLGHDGRVDVANLIARLRQALAHVAQQHQRVGPPVLGIGVGEMAANVAQGRCTEQRIDDGMQQHIGIGVAEQTMGVLNHHPTHHQGPTGHQGMHVPALTDAHLESHAKSLCVCCFARAANTASARAKSAG